MKHMHYTEVEEQVPIEYGAEGTTVRWLITEKDGAKNFAMRVFTIQPGGHTPYHQHDWEHELFMLEGKAALKTEENTVPFIPGEFAFIKANEMHQIRNDSKKPVRVICLIPYKAKC